MSLAPVLPSYIRVAASNLSDEELAYIVDMIKMTEDIAAVPGWSYHTCKRLDAVFTDAAQRRGIGDGVKTVNQIIDLRS